MTRDICLTINNVAGTSLTVVERCVWSDPEGGEWSEKGANHVLTINGDYWQGRGSGLIRFKEADGGLFHVVFGRGFNGNWCDLQTGLLPSETGVKLLPEYYRSGGRFSHESHSEVTRYTSSGRTLKLVIGDDAHLEYS
ncbi:hypothetical protein ZTR_04769 [Talaromyces verruculosus]|nr:hypothetical protein ZTR_04769 [Talaromyces verruculosus]